MIMDVDEEEIIIDEGRPLLSKQEALKAAVVHAEDRIPPTY
jgi:hypothetical protein